MKLNFEDEKNIYLVPKFLEQKDLILKFWKAQGLKGHVFICSSGTTNSGFVKSYAISKQAILENAEAVNKFLKAGKNDNWLCSLPPYHIGGLSIYARAFLAGAKVIELEQKWSAKDSQADVSFQSMVPDQLYRVVKNGLRPHKNLKGVFIGGDFLADVLRDKALKLDWPLIGTYGMTEVSSQLASRRMKEDFDGWLEILPIHRVIDDKVYSESLFSYEYHWSSPTSYEVIPALDFFTLGDKVELDGHLIRPLGRKSDRFKFKGRLYYFQDILNIFQSVCLDIGCYQTAALKIGHSPSKQDRLIVELEDHAKKEDLTHAILLNSDLNHLAPEIKLVEKLNKTELGKNKR